MTGAQKIIDWLTEHPDALAPEIDKGTNLPSFPGSYLGYLTRNGTLVRSGKKGTFRYRVAEQSDHPPAPSNGIPAADAFIPSGISELTKEVANLEISVNALRDAILLLKDRLDRFK